MLTITRTLRRSIFDYLMKLNSRSCSFSISSPFTDISPPKSTITELIWSRIEKWPNATALKCSFSGESISYSDLRAKSRQLALSLLKIGLKPKDIVTIVMPNSPAFVVSTLGVLEADMQVSFINPTFTEGEILHLLSDSESSAVITTNSLETTLLKVVNKIPNRVIRLISAKDSNFNTSPSHSEAIKFEDLLRLGAASQVDWKFGSPDFNASAILLYSSGTTGLPKGVCYSHRKVSCSVIQATSPDVVSVPEATSDFQPCVPVLLPMFHAYGLVTLTLKSLYAGAMLVTIPKFLPQQFLDVLKGNKNIFLHAVHPMIHFLHNHPEVTTSHLQNLRLTMVAGSAFPELDFEKLLSKWKHTVLNAYGTTETSVIAQSSPSSSSHSSLKLFPNVSSKIVSDSGEDLPFGQMGEICVRGPQVMTGYYKNPKATAETIDDDGWLHTGDTGFFDDNENLHVGGRIKELIKVKGFQVSPVELEDVIKTHPDVNDVAVSAIECPKAGERPVAFVVPKGERLKEVDIENYVSTRVAPYKRLSKVIFIRQVPRNQTGKILRRRLKEMI